MRNPSPDTLNYNAYGDEREELLAHIIRYALELADQRQIPGAITPHEAAIRSLRYAATRANVIEDPLKAARAAADAVHKARVAYELAVADEEAARRTLKAYESGE